MAGEMYFYCDTMDTGDTPGDSLGTQKKALPKSGKADG